jgi:hypothetical protein
MMLHAQGGARGKNFIGRVKTETTV